MGEFRMCVTIIDNKDQSFKVRCKGGLCLCSLCFNMLKAMQKLKMQKPKIERSEDE